MSITIPTILKRVKPTTMTILSSLYMVSSILKGAVCQGLLQFNSIKAFLKCLG
jgi:hypothetical protein